MCLKFWHDNILFATFWLNSMTCFLMYLRKASLDQRPISMIMNMGHSPRYMDRVRSDVLLLDSKFYFSYRSYFIYLLEYWLYH